MMNEFQFIVASQHFFHFDLQMMTSFRGLKILKEAMSE